ncbi:MAG: TonB-dependent receptor domain-containing protein [Saprospiraceae bacterium]
MRYYSFLLIITILFTSFVDTIAQTDAATGAINGTVISESNNQPLGYATITVFNAQDSTLINGSVTNDDGTFTVEVAPGNYYVEISFISYRSKIINNIQLTAAQPSLDLGTIALGADATTLSEIEVSAERSRLQMSLDKRVFNVGKDLANTGGTATEVLDNIPSVAVDVEGNVSLRGSGSVRILINGKPSGLVGISNADGLRNIPANMIERIEVVTNPSARYEAEGMSGIINIILKKEQTQGVNGSFDITTGYPDNYGAAINLNFRREKLNLFANYSAFYRRNPGGGFTYQRFTNNDSLFITEQDSDRERGGFANNMRTGLDYFFNDHNILTASFNYRMSTDENNSRNEYRDFFNALNNPTRISLRRDREIETEPNLEYALTFRRTYERQGHELVADIRYQENTEKENSNIIEEFYTPEFTKMGIPDLFQYAFNREAEQSLIAQLDYVQPFAEEGNFEMGLRAALRRIGTDYRVEEFIDYQWQILPGLSNNFKYNEDVYAAYAIWGNKYGQFSFQTGLRAELSDITTQLLQTNELNARDYFSLFPSAHIGYELANDNSLQLSYSRRISRPRFWDLNPFFSFSDARNFNSGNPNLDPEFTNALELGHLKYWGNASLSSSIYYRHTSGVIEEIQTIDNEGNTLRMPQNLAEEDAFGAEFTFSVSPKKWWNLDGSFNFYRAITDGGNIRPDLYADFYSWFTRLNSKLEIWKSLNAQIRANYRAPRNTTQGRDKSEYYIDLALSKDILKNNGTITFSVRDLFNSRRRRFITEGDNFFREGDFQWRARQVVLTLNYRINQTKKRERNNEREEDFDE